MKSKRILAVLLAASMTFSQAAPVFAVEVSKGEEAATEEVTEVADEEVVVNEENEKLTTTSNKIEETEISIKDEEYSLTINEAGAITGYTGKLPDELVIPEEIAGIRVQEIGEEAFWGNTDIVKVTFPSTLRKIGFDAFHDCTRLTTINNISENLTDLPRDTNFGKGTAFVGCIKLENVSFEPGVTRIPANLFWNCSGLKKIDIPKSVRIIGANAFRNCTNLKDVNIPADGDLDTIEDFAFNGDTLIDKIVFPEGLLTIGERNFVNCSFTEITFPSTIQTIGFSAFNDCAKLTTINNIPESLVNLPYETNYGDTTAFAGCNKLEKVSFESGITHIAGNLFWGCPGLKKIDIPKSVQKIDTNAFRNCINLKEVNIPADGDLDTIANCAFYGDTLIDKIVFPEGLLTIGERNFVNCSFTEITFPSTLQTIGFTAFADCLKLTTINNIPKSLVNLPYETNYGDTTAFAGCTKLENISFESGIENIAANLFWNCPGLKKVDIPKSVKTIGKNAFKDCTSLKEVNIPEDSRLQEIEDCAFNGDKLIDKIVFPEGLLTIGNRNFVNCSFTEITFPSTLQTIGFTAFADCLKLTTINNIPESLVNLPYETNYGDTTAFAGCTKLENVSFEPGITHIPNNLFWNCSGLKEITIPDTVRTIGYCSFRNCNSLKVVNLPSSIRNVIQHAFDGCSHLETVKYAATKEDRDYINIEGDNDKFINANWIYGEEHLKYLVTFVTDGGSEVVSQNVIRGNKVTKPVDPTKEGYVFAGWYTDSSFTTEFDFDTEITDDLSIYAKWDEASKTPEETPEDTPKDTPSDKPIDTPSETPSDNKTDTASENKAEKHIFVAGQQVAIADILGKKPEGTVKYKAPKGVIKVNTNGIAMLKKGADFTLEAVNKETKETICSCKVTIEQPSMVKKQNVSLASVSLNAASLITRGNEYTEQPKWISTKPSVASVDAETGVITLHKKGSAQIVAVFGATDAKNKMGTKKKYKTKLKVTA